MNEHRLLEVLSEATACAECSIAHASGGPSKCPLETSAYSAGDVIYTENDPADRIWFIRSGVVTIGHEGATSASIALKNSIIGTDCLVADKRTSSARAATDVQLCAMSKEELLQWLGNDKERLRIVIDAAMTDPDVVDQIDKL